MGNKFELEVGTRAVLAVVADEDSDYEVLKCFARESNGDVQFVGTDAPHTLALVAARVGQSIVALEITVRNEYGGIQTLQREVNIVVTPRDEDLLSVFILPADAETVEKFLAPESANDYLAEENAELRAKLATETKRADDLQELVDQHEAAKAAAESDVGTTSETIQKDELPQTPDASAESETQEVENVTNVEVPEVPQVQVDTETSDSAAPDKKKLRRINQ